MTLHFRLATAIILSFVLAILIGGTLVVFRADRSVTREMSTALAGDVEMVNDRLTNVRAKDLPSSLIRLVADFDGQRHVRAILRHDGRIVSSRLAQPMDLPPQWFVGLIDVKTPSRQIAAGSPWQLVLQTDPRNEIGEVWDQARDAFITIISLCCLIGCLVYLIVIRSLRSLGQVTQALGQVAKGDYRAAVSEDVPLEIAALARGFNQMAARLSQYAGDNSHLQQQIIRLQEEERADIARDLHDDVGPFLFSIGVDAQSITRLIVSGRTGDVLDHTKRIRDSVVHVQNRVRALLRQLRPNDRLDLGLETALHDLLAFWKMRHPDLRFELAISPENIALDRDLTEVAYRTIQESVSNALRHGSPRLVQISLSSERKNLLVRVANDGGAADFSDLDRGMGVSLMTERVRKIGGTLKIENGPHGVSVTANIPREKEALSNV